MCISNKLKTITECTEHHTRDENKSLNQGHFKHSADVGHNTKVALQMLVRTKACSPTDICVSPARTDCDLDLALKNTCSHHVHLQSILICLSNLAWNVLYTQPLERLQCRQNLDTGKEQQTFYMSKNQAAKCYTAAGNPVVSLYVYSEPVTLHRLYLISMTPRKSIVLAIYLKDVNLQHRSKQTIQTHWLLHTHTHTHR